MIFELFIYVRDAQVYVQGILIHLHGYYVDETGRIYSCDGKEIKPYFRGSYLEVKLLVGDKNKYFKVHRIVASSFPEICGSYNEVVNHLDENKVNNSAENLQWTTNKKNLSWGNIEKARKQGIKNSRKIREAVMDFCYQVRIPYINPKIKKTSYGYLAKSNIYTIPIYNDFTINWKKAKYTPHTIELISI